MCFNSSVGILSVGTLDLGNAAHHRLRPFQFLSRNSVRWDTFIQIRIVSQPTLFQFLSRNSVRWDLTAASSAVKFVEFQFLSRNSVRWDNA